MKPYWMKGEIYTARVHLRNPPIVGGCNGNVCLEFMGIIRTCASMAWWEAREPHFVEWSIGNGEPGRATGILP